jgi:hypothetical protein
VITQRSAGRSVYRTIIVVETGDTGCHESSSHQVLQQVFEQIFSDDRDRTDIYLVRLRGSVCGVR